jgi:aerobic carbon-monoxide dehydrogenase medium subunit
MKAAPFVYHSPESVDEAVSVLGEFSGEAKVLAGGQSLVPMLALRLSRPEHLVDINYIPELSEVWVKDGILTVGATTRHISLMHDPLIAESVPLLAKAAPHIGHFQIRNRGTIGGSTSHSDSAAELPCVTRALDAEFEVRGPNGTRRVPAEEFFVTTFVTVLEPEEMVVAVHFPLWAPGAGFAVAETARRHGDFALAGALCGVEIEDGRISRAAISLIGMGSIPIRGEAAEHELTGASVDTLDLAEMGRLAVADTDPPADVHAGSRYRTKVGATMVERALSEAIKEASNA